MMTIDIEKIIDLARKNGISLTKARIAELLFPDATPKARNVYIHSFPKKKYFKLEWLKILHKNSNIPYDMLMEICTFEDSLS